jgi:hypothetical protein
MGDGHADSACGCHQNQKGNSAHHSIVCGLTLLQRPFTIDGVQQCSGTPDGPDQEGQQPWWVPVSFRTAATAPNMTWTELEACSGSAPIYFLQVPFPSLCDRPRQAAHVHDHLLSCQACLALNRCV